MDGVLLWDNSRKPDFQLDSVGAKVVVVFAIILNLSNHNDFYTNLIILSLSAPVKATTSVLPQGLPHPFFLQQTRSYLRARTELYLLLIPYQ